MSTSKEPLVSVLIPTYNRPQYLELALQSVIRQTYPNIEIIISDDSTDIRTETVVAPYLKRYRNIIYRRNSVTLGQFDNDLKLIKMANGNYVNFLMDDDLFHPSKIERMIYYLENDYSVKLVTSHRQPIDGNGGFLDGWQPAFKQDTILDGSVMARLMLVNNYNFIGEPTTVLFRRDDLTEPVGVFEGRRYGCNVDQATWYGLLRNGKGVYLSDTLSYWRRHSGQQLHSLLMTILGAADYAHAIMVSPRVGFLSEETREFQLAVEKCLAYIGQVREHIGSARESDDLLKAILELKAFTLNLLDVYKETYGKAW